MNVTILNGNPDGQRFTLDGYIEQLVAGLAAHGHGVKALTLRDLDLRYCTGCFGCWVKTPGQCGTPDDSHQICRSALQADLLILASPVIMGFPSALLKQAVDKLLPLIHPYFDVVEGECHHRARYDHYPLVGLLLERGDADDQDLAIIRDIFSRTALNFRSRLAFSVISDQSVLEVQHAIIHETYPV